MIQSGQMQLVGADEIEEYPISSSERLDSHYFVQFNVRRYERSNFRKKAHRDPEVGFIGMELFFKSHGEVPLGTLPCDDDSLSFLLGMSLERWMSLRERSFNPLYNWRQVKCDSGEIRLAHPVVQKVMEEALRGNKELKASNEDKAVYARRRRLVEVMRDIGCSADACSDEFAVAWLDQWLVENHLGQRRMPQFQHSITRALRAAATEGVLGRSRGGL